MLEDIGFYTLSDNRAATASSSSPLSRCELILTDRCNFSCAYCRGPSKYSKGTLSFRQAHRIIEYWCYENLENIRFSGGEPTLFNGLYSLVSIARDGGIKRIAISSNGSAKPETYISLIGAGVNDFSISLDACCASGFSKATGNGSYWIRVIENIKLIAKRVYTTVGVVLTEENQGDTADIIKFALDNLGVSDVRIIPAAQYGTKNRIKELQDIEATPILKYRMDKVANGLPVRGIQEKDCSTCRLVLDDMAIAGKYHFPCIIYMREHGKPIGRTDNLANIRAEREQWVKNTDIKKDPICSKNCLDVCVDYNNMAERLGVKA